MAIELDLPWPPSVNGAYDVRPVISNAIVHKMMAIYRQSGVNAARAYAVGAIRGGWTLSAKGKHFCDYVRDHVQVDTITGPVQIVHDFTPPDRRKRDVYNYHKVLHDALTKAGVYEDDSQIMQGTEYLHPPKKHGGVHVIIEECD